MRPGSRVRRLSRLEPSDMRCLLDMNLAPTLAEWLRAEGHDAIHVAEAGFGELPDKAIFEHAAVDRRVS